MKITSEHQVGELVSADYRLASVFKNKQIDFCCKGNRTLDDVCSHQNLAVSDLISELESVLATNREGTPEHQSWDLDLLADYIQKKHHRYVENKIPELISYLQKLVRVHGERHPELIEIYTLFSASSADLLHHMKKEEMVLFPGIRSLVSGTNQNAGLRGSLSKPIQMMQMEHENEGDRFRRIAALSNNYNPPEDACTTYRVAFSLLKEFEEDLHLHIHLENNVLFPRTLAEESRFSNN